jgi:hypothetical protein
MLNKNWILKMAILLVGSLFFFNIILKFVPKHSDYSRLNEIRKLKLSNRIEKVVISRTIEIIVNNYDKPLNIAGMKCVQEACDNALINGDSIFKAANSDTVFTKKGKFVKTWILPK